MITCFRKIFSTTKPQEKFKLDFSHVDSRKKAADAVKNGELFPILMFPGIFGGEDIDANRLYVPPGIPEAQNHIISTLARFVEEGLIDNMEVTPEYKKTSVVPSKINIKTYKNGNLGQFSPTIDIW